MTGMIHELRIETARPGHLPALAAAFADTARALTGVDAPKAAWTSEAGELNKLLTLWQYDDDGERTALVARREASEAWSLYVRAALPLVVHVEAIRLQPMREITPSPSDCTLVDFRMYTMAPFRAGDYVGHLLGILPVRHRYSQNYCVWQQHSGTVHRVMHMWPYRSYEHRASVRAAMAADPAWNDFLGHVYPLMERQKSSLLRVLDLQKRP